MTDLEELRWYKSGQLPEYSLQHWWRKSGEIERCISAVDDENEILFEKDQRNRSAVRLAPWLWEVLRRHPQLLVIRREYIAILGSIEIVGFKEYNRNMLSFLEAWEGRGEKLITSLARYGHLPWSGVRGSDGAQLLPVVQEDFASAISEFSEAPENFRNGLKLPARPLIFEPILLPSAEDRLLLTPEREIRTKSPRDFTLGEYQDAAAKKGRELLVLEVDLDASPETLSRAVKNWCKARLKERPEDSSKRMRPNSDRLNLMELLDSSDELSKEVTQRIDDLFSSFQLSASS